ncbi:unnamed protein product [Gadus morhua 'NCC']
MRESCSLTLNSHEDDRPGATRPRYSLGAFPPLIVDRWVQCFQPTTTPTTAPNPSLQPRLRNHTPTLPTIPQNGTGQHCQKLRGYQRHHKQEKQNPPPRSDSTRLAASPKPLSVFSGAPREERHSTLEVSRWNQGTFVWVRLPLPLFWRRTLLWPALKRPLC